MKITPLDIRQKSFEKVFRGYDKDEVQAFLNSLSHEWERVQDEYKEMKIRLEQTQKEVEKLRQVESSLYKTLKTAEETGASLIDQANKTADLRLKEAEMEAEEKVKKASDKARKIVETAEKTSKAVLEEMKDAINSVETDYYRLQSMKEDLLLELKNISNDTLEKLDRYKNQKNKFSFEDHLKKAKSYLRSNWRKEDEPADSTPVEEAQNTASAANEGVEEIEQTEEHIGAQQQENAPGEENKENRSFFDDI